MTAQQSTFCSLALRKVLQRLGYGATQLDELEKASTGNKVLLALAQSGAVEEEVLLQEVSKVVRIEVVSGDALSERTEHLQATIRDDFEKDFLFQYRCVPIEVSPNKQTIAMADPLDTECISEWTFRYQHSPQIVLASERDILNSLQSIFSETAGIVAGLELLDSSSAAVDPVDFSFASIDEVNIANQNGAGATLAPVVRLVNQILSSALSREASDIHFEPAEKQFVVRFRVDGVMVDFLTLPVAAIPYVLARIKILSGMDITVRFRPQDGRFSVRRPNKPPVDVRVSAVPTPFGEKIVLRLLWSNASELHFSDLGVQEKTQKQIEKLLAMRERVIIVTGPTGSGKSTTLYAALNYLNTGDLNIVTVEDPIEFRLPGITQIQVDTKVGMTFANGLRSMLRQDPDVILVGEIRDKETAEISCQAAQTGHLVLSTLHCNNAPSAVTRLRDLGIESFVLASSLGGVLAQRLVRRICNECREELPEEEKEQVTSKWRIQGQALSRGKGCKRCGGSGYRGRIGIYSVLELTPQFMDAVRNGASESELNKIALASGMISLFQYGLNLAEQGITTVNEIVRVMGVHEEEGSSSKELSSAPASTRILIIDDEQGVRDLLQDILSKHGYAVETACNGVEGVRLLPQFSPQIVLCDLRMPEMNGFEFVKKVRQDPSFTKVQIIMLTGDDSEGNEIAMLGNGADDFLSKSASLRLILSHVQRAIQRSSF